MLARLVEDPFAKLNDQPYLLGDGDEVSWRYHAAPRVGPPQESLEPRDAFLRQIDIRLEEYCELVGDEGLAKVDLKFASGLYQIVHRRLEEAEPIAAVAFGLIERDVGALEQEIRIRAIPRCHSNPDAGADDHVMAGDLEGGAELVQQTYRHRRHLGRVVDAALHDRKLVAAEAGHCIGLSHDAVKPLGHRFKQGVPDRMAERVVDAFELVEIEAKHGARFAARDAIKGVLQPLAEQNSIGQIG